MNIENAIESLKEDMNVKHLTIDAIQTELLEKRKYLEEMKLKRDILIKEKKLTNKNNHSIFEQLNFLKNFMKNPEIENCSTDFLACFKKIENCLKTSEKNKETVSLKKNIGTSRQDLEIAFNACNFVLNFAVHALEKSLDTKNEKLQDIEKSVDLTEKRAKMKQDEYSLKKKEIQTFQENIISVIVSYLNISNVLH